MKLFVLRAILAGLGLALLPLGVLGQGSPLMGMGNGARFDGHMAKLFATQPPFVCALEVEASPSDRPDGVTMPGRLSFSEGRTRLEMDLTKIRGGMLPAGMIDQIKALGMAEMAIVSRPDTGSSVIIYPGLKSYAPVASEGKPTKPDQFNLASKELGKESVNGQACVKNQVTITGPDGKKFEATVWNATQLKNFPLRIRSNEGGVPFTLNFNDVKFEKPAAALFEAPASFTKYDDAQALMRGAVMKKLGEANGSPATK